MKKSVFALTAAAVLLLYLFTCLVVAGFYYPEVAAGETLRPWTAGGEALRTRAAEGRDALLAWMGRITCAHAAEKNRTPPFFFALYDENGRIFQRGYTLQVDEQPDGTYIRADLGPYLTAASKNALADFFKSCPEGAYYAKSGTFHRQADGSLIPTRLQLQSPYTDAVACTLTLAELPGDTVLSLAGRTQLDPYDVGCGKRDLRRFRRLEEILTELEALNADRTWKEIFLDIREFGGKDLTRTVAENRQTGAFRRLLFGNTLRYDLVPLQADGADYVFVYLSLYNIPEEILRTPAYRNSAAVIGAVYALTGAALLLAERRLMKKKERLDRTRRALTAAAAHELKTPLAVIQSQSECVLDGIAPARDREYVASIREEALRMGETVNVLLWYNRLSNTRRISPGSVDLAVLLREEIEKYGSFAEGHGVTLTVSAPPSLPVRGDPDLLRLAVDNYLSNAIRYATGNKTVRVTLAKKRRGFRFETENACPPLTKRERNEIWSLLSRRDAARGDRAPGMGLPLCAEIFRLHRFRCGCEATPDGVRFFFGK